MMNLNQELLETQNMITLQRFGLTAGEINRIPPDERSMLIETLEDCEMRDVCYSDVLKRCVREYGDKPGSELE